MTASPKASSESDIIAALKANNPFESPPVVKAQNIWGDSFPDVSSLNAIASNTVFDALGKVRVADSILNKVTSMVFTAERGVGKSHVIKRIRRRLQSNGEGIFVYASADKYGALEHINSLFQQSVAESLDQMGSEGVSQWQEIATLMVAEALTLSKSSATAPAAASLVQKFDKVYHSNRLKNRDLVTDLSKTIHKVRPGSDLYILRAIIWTLSEERGSFAVKWLAGEQLDTQDAADLRLPTQNKTNSEKDSAAPNNVSKLLSLIGEYKSVIVCFDELDNEVVNADGLPASIVILDLVKRLVDSIGSSERGKGIVLLTVLLPDSWRHISRTKMASSEKITSYGKPIPLEYLNAKTTYELAEITLQKFFRKKGLISPTPIFPLDEIELSAFGKGKPFPREALNWFATEINKKLKDLDPSPSPVSYRGRLAQAYQNALSQFDSDDLEDNDRVASALRFCFQKITEIDKLKDLPIEGVVVKALEDITPKGRNSGWIHFKVVGQEDGEPVAIGVSVLQHTHGLSVGAGFRRLLDIEAFGLSRSCLVRSQERKIMRCWDSYEYYQRLVAMGGEWVNLTASEIYPLLAMQYVYEHHEKFKLTVKRLDSLAFVRNLLQESPLLREILSRPEGVVSENALDGKELQRLSDTVDLAVLEAELSEDLQNEEEDINEVERQIGIQELTEVAAV